MGKIDDFHVEFDNKWSVYEPGETVRGKVTLKLNDRIVCDGLKANFYGSARVFWVTREMRDQKFGSVTYNQERVYFNEQKPLWEYSRDTKALENLEKPGIAAGSHEFQFDYVVPDACATSFDSRHSVGYIRYFVKVAFWLNDAMKNSKKFYFTVVRPQDLNAVPRCARPVVMDKGVEAIAPGPGCCLTPNGGMITCRATLQKSGYVPGEALLVSAEIDNETANRKVRGLRAKLIQRVKCFADRPEFTINKSQHIVCSAARDLDIRPQKTGGVMDLQMYVPAVVPTLLEENVIEVTYVLQVSIYTHSLASPSQAAQRDISLLDLELPIMVGSVPLNENALSAAAAVASSAESYRHDGPPPTYEESVLGFTNGGGDRDELLSPPRYAVFEKRSQPIN